MTGRIASMLFAGLSLLIAGEAFTARPNIVFILSDNQTAGATSPYGNRDVRTPNLEQLARDGVRFSHAYAASGMCSPTRATLMTGLMPSQHGLHNALFDPWVDGLDPGWNAVAEFRTLPYTLARRGYRTAMIGKWHLGDTREPSLGFQHWVALPYGHTLDFWNNELVENGRRYAVKDRHIVDVLAEKAVDYLGSVDDEKPFYLQLNLDGPYSLPPSNHGPGRNRHYASYAGKPFRSMPSEPISDRVLSRLGGPYDPSYEFGISDLGAVWDYILYGTIRMQGDRESYANFLSQNTVVDDAVGRVIDALKARGLLESTVIVFSSDQGNLFGQHGTWGHTMWFTPAHLYEEAMHVPLIVRSPGGRSGVVSDRLIGQYDVPVTLLALAGVEDAEFEGSPGRSFAADFTGGEPPAEWNEAVYFEQEESRGLRTQRYAYWKRLDDTGEPVLFDMQADPAQRNDLYPKLRESERVAHLDGMLESWFDRYADPAYDLWAEGIAKGTNPKPGMWIQRNPWPWIRKYWQDFVTEPPSPPAFSE